MIGRRSHVPSSVHHSHHDSNDVQFSDVEDDVETQMRTCGKMLIKSFAISPLGRRRSALSTVGGSLHLAHVCAFARVMLLTRFSKLKTAFSFVLPTQLVFLGLKSSHLMLIGGYECRLALRHRLITIPSSFSSFQFIRASRLKNMTKHEGSRHA